MKKNFFYKFKKREVLSVISSLFIINITTSRQDKKIASFLLFLPVLSGFFTYIVLNYSLIVASLFTFFVNVFVTLPLQVFLTKKNKWYVRINPDVWLKLWPHPAFYLNISVWISYLYLFVLYFSIVRYVRLGKELDFSNIVLSDYSSLLSLILVILTLGIGWVYLFYKVLDKTKDIITNYFVAFCEKINYICIQNKYYFVFCEKLYKALFFISEYLHIHSSSHYKNPIELRNRTVFPRRNFSKFRKFLFYITYMRPQIFNFVVILSLIFEVALTKKLYFGLYTLFYYPLIVLLIRGLKRFHESAWTQNVCISDYMHDNWEKPHYPVLFCCFCETDPLWYFGYEKIFTPETELKKDKFCLNYTDKYYNLQNTYKFCLRVTNNPMSSLTKRIAVSYRDSKHVRWMHTSSYTSHVKPVHPLCSAFTKTQSQRMACMNHLNQHNVLNNSFSKQKYDPEVFRNNTPGLRKLLFPDFLNESIIKQCSSEESVEAKHFDKEIIRTSSAQACDDVLFVFASTDQGVQVVGMDMKTGGQVGAGVNIILPPRSLESAQNVYDHYFDVLKKRLPPDSNWHLFKKPVQSLKEDPSFANWVKLSPLFPSNLKPPFLLNFVVDPETLTDTEKEAFEKSAVFINELSNELYKNRAPAPIKGKAPENFKPVGQELYRSTVKRVLGIEPPEDT